MKRIECIIMDWAGTAVDYSCFCSRRRLCREQDHRVPRHCRNTCAHGADQSEEIRALFDIERVRAEFERKFGRPAEREDVQARYAEFQRCCLPRSKIIPTYSPVVERFPHCVRKGIRHWLHRRLYPLYDGCCAACRHSQRLCGDNCVTPTGCL